MKRLPKRLFGGAIEPGEERAVGLLLAQSMGIGVFRSFFLATASAQFLSQFEVRFAPLAYIAAGLVGYGVVAIFGFFRKRVPFSVLLFGTLFFVLALVLAFRVGFLFTDTRWLSFALFVCIGPIATLMDLEFGGLAGRLFNLQQSKRLFSLIGSGEAAASIVGFFMVPVLLTVVDDALSLLLYAASGIAFCIVILAIIQRQLGDQLRGDEKSRAKHASAERGQISKRYFVLLSLGMAALILSHYFIDFSFLSQTKSQFESREAIGSFMGLFFGLARTAELLSKLFFANWLIRQFGLSAGLLTLPAGLLLCVGLAALSGSILGTAAASFFLLVAGARFIMFVLRKSLFDPSSKVLYQPLPAGERFAMETRVGGTVRQVAMIIAGLALLALNRFPGFSVVFVMYVLVALLAGWVVISRKVFGEYRNRLVAMLRSLPKKALVASPAEVIRRRLLEATAPEVRFSGNVLRQVDPELLEDVVVDLAQSDVAEIREEALREIADLRLSQASPLVSRIAETDPDPKVKAVANHTAGVLRQKEAFQAGAGGLGELTASTDSRERRLAAHVLASSTPETHDESLFALLWDPEPSVRHAAIAAAGRQGGSGYWPRLIDQVSSGRFCNTAAAALVEVGEPVFEELEITFRRLGEDPVVLCRLLRIFERVGGARAEDFLLGNVAHPNREVQRQALFSLNVLGYQAGATEVPLIKARIERTVDAIVWYAACRADLSGEEEVDDLLRALRSGDSSRRQNVFLLLALICDAPTVRLLQEHAASESSEDRAYALEIAEQAMPEELADLLFPVLEALPPAVTHERLKALFPHSRLSRADRLRDIIRQGNDRIDHWTRACAMAALSEAEAAESVDELAASLFSPNLMVAEIAGLRLSRASPGLYAKKTPRLGSDVAERLRSIVAADSASGSESDAGAPDSRPLLAFEKVLILAATPIFAGIEEATLAEAGGKATQRQVEKGTVLFSEGDPGRALYVVVEGDIRIEKDGAVLSHVGARQLLGEIAAVEHAPRSASAIAAEASQLLGLDQEAVFELMADHAAVIPGIVEVIARRRARG